MTHHDQITALDEITELLAEHGFDGIAQAVRVNVEARSTKEFRDGVRRFAPRPEK